ncbi:MAG: sodium-translocating pyrophosphatase [Synergistales bacterium]|nr:sodium-translocating pyrophosphatase [Synergistales bacterium]MDY6400711.1 sodium-translocating pyrophosphatase [Synergistales bacterium]MDY6404837.1 sodium-translocating pyrophosphatase [Synergistales bacterium]MDY6410087.1 sodium-translocating pyrophosphatase [Synergistales bacterium]MDY6413817.1 sodium-translocating pyrophosphatase [Synergistales bacterium]
MWLFLVFITLVFGVLAGLYAWTVFQKLEENQIGHARVAELSTIIHGGAMAFLKKEYTWLAPFVGVVALLLVALLGLGAAFAFILGALCSATAGYIGMYVATNSNGRTTYAALEGMEKDDGSAAGNALEVAFSGGSIVGMVVVGLGLIGLSVAYLFLNDVTALTAFGMGASSIALFARVGGGIYTKAADVGADLVGKVEAGIPEDDPRNPAVIADNVGDNVGDIAGMGADLFESYVNSILAAMAIGAVYTFTPGVADSQLGLWGIGFPMFLAAWGVFASIIGCMMISQKAPFADKVRAYAAKLPGMANVIKRIEDGDAAFALRTGTFVAGGLMIAGTFILSILFFFSNSISVFLSVTSGVLAGIAIGVVTEIYTSGDYKFVQKVAESSDTGTATVILSGLSLGMMSTGIPVLLICLSTLISYYLAGMFGVAVAAVGMLSITGISLSVDAYGPIADNAGGIAEMSELPEGVRKITDHLDAIGNTTAAMGKGLAIGSAALTALALFVAYSQAAKIDKIDIMNPYVIIGLLIGGMLPFIFCALSIDAVSKAAGSMIEEVRNQFRTITGIMEGTGKPDYERCVSISTHAALTQMIIPGVMAIVVPVLVGFLLGKEALGGLLGGAIVTGVMMALFMANSGGAWDNAKKYIEEGHFGGKGSTNHAAAVVGDTVGDPFKDTAGPALNILIKLMTVVALVLAPLF